uniref:Outer-membrane lipoprotein LolB n=1 Tax=uncultured Thiotrichaceae bacterium TaxID=298394 RepID=A0A6S6UGK3_9GAMM|nr:MAG: Outer-membrane lipoprotein LolB [uncultured Thiotrichaceae bacterium]
MKNGILLLCVLSIVGCTQNNMKPADTGQPKATVGGSPEAVWQNRQRVFARMKEWSMNGRVGLQLRGQSWSFGMKWDEKVGGVTVMDITNPLTGAVMANIRETQSQVVLKAADGKSYRDTNAERLLERQLKLKFPLNDMRYWARGLPSPDKAVEAVKLDSRGRPQQLQQDGWVVEYTAYKDQGGNALPTKMRLEKASERAKAKVVAKQWKTRF